MTTTPALFAAYSSLMPGTQRQEKNAKPDPSPVENTFNGRLGDITQIWLSESERGECILTGQVTTSQQSLAKRFGTFSLLLRRNVYPESLKKKSELQLEIQSASLCEVIRAVASPVRTFNIHATPIIVKEPYHDLYHFKQDIIDHSLELGFSTATNDSVVREIQELTKFLNESVGLSAIADMEALKASGKISMDYLWSLFRPGEAVLLYNNNPGGQQEISCGIVQSYYNMRLPDGSPRWCLKLRHWSFEGGDFGVIEREYRFATFTGHQDILDLPVFPLSYTEDAKKLKKTLSERGRKYVRLCRGHGKPGTPTHWSYNGPIWIQRKPWEAAGCDFFDDPERMISGRVIVDPVGYVSEHTLYRNRIVSQSLFEFEDSPEDNKNDNDSVSSGSSSANEHEITGLFIAETDPEDLDEDELMAFPSRIGGYSLFTKDAGFIQVDGLSDIRWNTQHSEYLSRNSRKIEDVLRIASGFSFSTGQIGYENKGAGLTFLFFGPSGVGKTLTAECVAELLRRPLYRVSGSEIGKGPYEIERRLTQAFNRTARWKAILLFDEADTFMARRNDESIERNAMVSCLLRILEYHAGIVILTTNRISDFDTAFHSRIHVSIEYKSLTMNEKMSIWRKELNNRLGSRNAVTDADIGALAQLDLDGRTIFNTVHVLGLFMETEKKKNVSLAHVKQVLTIATGKLEGEARQQVEEFCNT